MENRNFLAGLGEILGITDFNFASALTGFSFTISLAGIFLALAYITYDKYARAKSFDEISSIQSRINATIAETEELLEDRAWDEGYEFETADEDSASYSEDYAASSSDDDAASSSDDDAASSSDDDTATKKYSLPRQVTRRRPHQDLEEEIRLTELKVNLVKDQKSASINKKIANTLAFVQYIVGGTLATSFVQEILSGTLIGLFGLTVLVSSLITQHFRPLYFAKQARERVYKAKHWVRLIENKILDLGTDPLTNKLAISVLRMEVTDYLQLLENHEMQSLQDNPTDNQLLENAD